MIQQMVMIVYNEAIDLEVMEALSSCGLKNYTKVCGVFGRGETSGSHLGNHIWPEKNNILYVACSPVEANNLLNVVNNLRHDMGKEGVKAFVWELLQSS
ncbi:MAG: hypothetical protein JW847_02130 [Candidatus Omnitrophica bacterium]|nr:hypothetical protein [Candidatus Omnitrophota bacterium]